MNSLNFNEEFMITVPDFDLKQSLECGQCFRYYNIGPNAYVIVANKRVIKVAHEQEQVIFSCDEAEFKAHWLHYFDLERDYGAIKQHLSNQDAYLKVAITEKQGVRLLQQDPWEMLISFILSQTKQIPHIKKLIEDLSLHYGTYIGHYQDQAFYAFPTPEQMESVTEAELRALKVGFRATYIVDAVQKVRNNLIDLETLRTLSNEDIKKQLKTIKGVGDKIADCVLLFAYSRYDVFPADVWIKRIIEHYYLLENSNLNKIQEFAKNYFGIYAGFAQQYLFYYGRDNKLGK